MPLKRIVKKIQKRMKRAPTYDDKGPSPITQRELNYGVHAYKMAADHPELWAPRRAAKHQSFSSKGKLIKRTECPTGFHKSTGWDYIRSSKTHCLRDCDGWSPRMVKASNGRCQRPKSEWMKELVNFYHDRHDDDSSYTYAQAMKDLSKEWKKTGKTKPKK